MRRLLIALLALLITGCSRVVLLPPNTPAPTAIPIHTPTPQPVTLTEDQITAIALQLSDLQEGFKGRPDQTRFLTYESLMAQNSPKTAEFLRSTGDFTAYKVSFSRTTDLLTITQMSSWVIVFASEDGASRYVREVPALIGADVEPRLITFQNYGQETFAYNEVSETENFRGEVYIIAIRQRNAVATILYAGHAGLADLDEVDSYVAAVAERLVDAVPDP